jgi:hypothetical protein
MQQQSYSTFLPHQQACDMAKQSDAHSSELQYLDNLIATHGAATANTVSDPELKGYNEQLTNLENELTHWTRLKSQHYNDEYICQPYRDEGSLGSEDDVWYDKVGRTSSGQGSSPAVLPANGGTSLRRDENE